MSDYPDHAARSDAGPPAPAKVDDFQDAGFGDTVTDDLVSGAFRWPTPPFATYPVASAQQDSEPCQIVGLNGRVMQGRLNFFVPTERVAHIQVPPARTTMPLRFNQFRTILLTRPIEPTAVSQEVAQHDGGVLTERPVTDYRVHLVAGGTLEGDTIGHVENEFGLFLFPPVDEKGSVNRLFVPSDIIAGVEIGPLIGQALIDAQAVTPDDVDQAMEVQHNLRNQKLGDILLTQKVVSPEQLIDAIERQSHMPMVRIGEALIALGLISEEQLQIALKQQQHDRTVPLGELLVRLGMVSRQDLLSALARKMGYPLVDLDKFPADPDALNKVPFNVAARLLVAPLLLHEATLIVAVEDPSKRTVLSELEFVTQCKIVPVLANQSQLEWSIRDAYARLGADVTSVMFTSFAEPAELELETVDSGKLVEDLEKEGLENKSYQEEDRPIEQSDNSLVRLINTMIVEAYTQGVSDIHIESYPGRDKIKIRFRKDGGLVPYLELPHNYRSAMIARIKIMCDLDISERRKPQDGKINFARFVPQYRLELRVATIPTNNGLEDVVMRILSSARPLPLDKIGLSETNLGRLKTALERPYGMILCVGPTGSGKTTTLHSALSFINVPERKIWTAEDPVEITQPGLRQVQINPKIDWTFAKALRAFLRADPDVIMVGEIRDHETADMGVEASLTGHLVLSTLHTNSAPETVTRLLDMGMDPFNFADALLVVLAQRLVRRLCSACKVSEPASQAYIDDLIKEYMFVFPEHTEHISPEAVQADWQQRLGRDGVLMSHTAKGCPQCNNTGYKGRAGLHELLSVSREIRRMIQTGANAEALLNQSLKEGMRTLRQDGIEKVLSGITSMEEVRASSNI
ncbi:MAG TPA: ATPase, T2SS/T4P/T4SS family [Aquabacterium sp.]|uniref:GspE/PulE family protein n=1 Tax=Aquabacterium sp. TaxID=1872578 RepID=UPI002E33D157|nr:ATPase, T2SS/T4P/T4SS family [Aquabacterium sp.]HEX5354621.1 ATPase, T2SS/T4P/T4SS family [Aquabacterium sp.]